MTTLLVTLSPALFALLVRPAGKRHKRLRLRERAALPAPRQSSFCGLWALAPRESFPEPHKNTTTGAKARVLAPFPNAALEGPLFHGALPCSSAVGAVSVLLATLPMREGLEVLDTARAPRETRSNASLI